jgi:hypothetical protein
MARIAKCQLTPEGPSQRAERARCKGEARKTERAGCLAAAGPGGAVCRPALVDRPRRYWMTETTLLGVNGSVGAFAPAAETSCQIAPAALVANARLPVDAGLVGTAVA